MRNRDLSSNKPENTLRDPLIKFFQSKLEVKLRPVEAIYILEHRFDSFCVAFNNFTDLDSEIHRKSLSDGLRAVSSI